jgi:eukaryotic-like serine/threonine-protein kinase
MTSDETHAVPSHRLADDGQDAAAAVIEGWSRLLAYLVVAIVVGFTAVLPFFGLLLALAGASYLRAGDVHTRRHRGGLLRKLAGPLTAPLDLVRGVGGTLVTLPYAAVFAVVVPMLVMLASAVDIEVSPVVGAAWGAAAASYVLLAAPGVRTPRRHLVRVFTAFAEDPRRIAVGGVALCVLALAAVAGAIVLQPSFTPMYELENSLAQRLSHLQHSVHRYVR